jgi:hypothetical protein
MPLSGNVPLKMMLGWLLLAHTQLSEAVNANDNSASLATLENLGRLVVAMAFMVGQEKAREIGK